jgi:hypothetical protein
LDGPPAGDGAVLLDAPGTNPAAYMIFRENRFKSNLSPGPITNPYAITIQDTSGNGGANILVFENNQIAGDSFGGVNDASRVKGWFRSLGNYSLGTSPLRSGIQAYTDCIQANPLAGNTGTGQDTLMTCALSGGNIRAENVGIRIVASGITASNGNNKEITILLDGNTLFTTGVVAANNIDWKITCDGARSSSSGMRITCQGNPLSTTTIKTTNTAVSGLTFTNAIAVDTTGEGVATNDIVQYFFHVEIIR